MSNEPRAAIQKRLFPNGIPRLWAPTLTHFAEARVPDADHIRKHLEQLAPYAKGILVPGSTGEGWEMSDEDIRRLLDIVLPAAHKSGVHLLIGVLKTNTDEVLTAIDRMADFSHHPAFVGFTVCPPKGENLSQLEIASSLRAVLSKGYPTALYQLPQVTLNEMTPETVASLAAEFPNFILFKDTSGFDRVARSGLDLKGLFLVRGSEKGGYSQWLRMANGPYDGFLLSTANSLAPEFARMLELLDEGKHRDALELSQRLEKLVASAFAIVQDLPVGNPFTNANKLLHHLRSFESDSLSRPGPMLYSGARIPDKILEAGLSLLVPLSELQALHGKH